MNTFSLDNQSPTDASDAARKSPNCVCGGNKGKGTLVCWDCFKHRTDTTPLKNFQGSYVEWVAQLPKSSH